MTRTSRLLWGAVWLVGAAHAASAATVGPVPPSVRSEFQLAPFYQKYVEAGGLPIVGSESVSDFALLEAEWIVKRMLGGREDVLTAMADNRVRLAVMAWNEYTTDVPEHSHLTPKVFWDRRARGLGATPAAPAVSCAEENLLGYENDPYAAENILIHEFAHAIHAMGLSASDPTFDDRLHRAYRQATSDGLWLGTYAGTNADEYWAEAVQSWFDDNRENDSLHNHVNTREELRAYDPPLAKLCEEVFGDGMWRYRKPAARPAPDRSHLEGYDASRAPRFVWRVYPVTETPRVLIQTALGDIEVELDARRAPITVSNFLRYTREGFYSDGEVFRTVTLLNQPDDSVKIEVVQASADPAREAEAFAPIVLERTSDTGLRHRDGTISMARLGPDSAQHNFFICVGDQPELDFGGRRQPDGQGFAAFGQVVKGMDVVRRIHRSPAEGQALTPPIRIQRAVRRH